MALKEIAKARDLLRENPSHPLGVEIEQEEKVATQEQFDVCRKWGLEFAARGDKLSLERAQEYRDVRILIYSLLPFPHFHSLHRFLRLLLS